MVGALASAAAGLLAVRFLAIAVGLMAVRVPYPFELEWMEGGSLAHVLRLLAGDAIYAEPSAAWVPFIYHPLYYVVAAPLVAAFGVGLPPLRLVSALSSVATGALLGRLAWRETRSPWAGVVAPGLYAATFPLQGGWLDIARADSLALALIVGGTLAVREARSARGMLWAGVLLYLAMMTKQTTAWVAMPVVAFAVWRDGPRGLALALGVAAAMLATMGLFAATSDGWYLYYCFELPRSHTLIARMWGAYWTEDLAPLGIALFAAVALPFLWLRRPRGRAGHGLVAAFVVGTLVAGYHARLHSGNYINVLQIPFAGLALALAVVAFRPARIQGRTLSVVLAAAAAVQLVLLDFDPRRHRPPPEAWDQGRAVLRVLAEAPRPLYAPELMSYTLLLGAPPAPHAVAVEDVLRGEPEEPKARYLSSVARAARAGEYGAIVLGSRSIAGSTVRVWRLGYRYRRALEGPSTLTGMGTYPRRILERREP